MIEYPYREPLWAQLITAHYLAERQSDALDAYRRLKTALAEDLGIDPGPDVRELHERILRQEPLDVKRAAKSAAVKAVTAIDQRTSLSRKTAVAALRNAKGRRYPLLGAATRIGRLRTTTSFSTTPKSAATTPSSSTPAPASSSPICGRPTECTCKASACAIPSPFPTATGSPSSPTSSSSRSFHPSRAVPPLPEIPA